MSEAGDTSNFVDSLQRTVDEISGLIQLKSKGNQEIDVEEKYYVQVKVYFTILPIPIVFTNKTRFCVNTYNYYRIMHLVRPTKRYKLCEKLDLY